MYRQLLGFGSVSLLPSQCRFAKCGEPHDHIWSFRLAYWGPFRRQPVNHLYGQGHGPVGTLSNDALNSFRINDPQQHVFQFHRWAAADADSLILWRRVVRMLR